MAASNHSEEVVHSGKPYTAKSPADPCLNGTYENTAPSANLGAGATTKTTIEDNRIAVVGTHWDPSESAGVTGVKSATTKKEAFVTEGSPDLVIEGKPAARVQDPTRQNHDNSAGKVEPGNLKPSLESLEERAKKRCKLTEWTATSGDKGVLGYPGRDKIGKPNYLEVKRDDTVTFTSKRHDITKTPHEENPKCEMAPHTKWIAVGKKFPLFLDEGKKTAEGTETFVVPASLVVETFANAEVMAAVKKGDMATAMNAMAGQLLTASGPTKKETGGTFGDDDAGKYGVNALGGKLGGQVGLSASGPSVSAKYERGILKGADGEARAKVSVDVRTLLFFFWWWISAPEIKVTATSCSGALDATLKVYPKEALEFEFEWDKAMAEGRTGKYDSEKKKLNDQLSQAEKTAEKAAEKAGRAIRSGAAAEERGMASQAKADSVEGNSQRAQQRRNANQNNADEAFDEAKKQYAKADAALAKFANAEKTVEAVKESLKTLEKTLSVLQRLSDIASTPIKYEIGKGLKLKIGLSYERCSDQMSARGWRYYTAAQVGQVWSVELSCDTLVGVSWTARMSLLALAGPYMAYVAQLLRQYRIFTIDLGLSVGFEVPVSVTIEKKQHDEFSGSGNVGVKFKVGIFMESGAGGVDIVKLSMDFPSELKVEFKPPEEKGALLKGTPKFSTSNYYAIVLFPDRWWKVKVASGSIAELQGNWNKDGSFYWSTPAVPA